MAILNYLNKREFKFRKFCYLIVVGALCISLSILLNTYADQVKSSEHRIKAAFLYNFAKFVQWPAGSFGGPEDPIILCILGVNPFGEALKTIENKVVRGRPLLIRKIRETGKTGTEKIKDCHILFISISENENVTEILSAIRGRPILFCLCGHSKFVFSYLKFLKRCVATAPGYFRRNWGCLRYTTPNRAG